MTNIFCFHCALELQPSIRDIFIYSTPTSLHIGVKVEEALHTMDGKSWLLAKNLTHSLALLGNIGHKTLTLFPILSSNLTTIPTLLPWRLQAFPSSPLHMQILSCLSLVHPPPRSTLLNLVQWLTIEQIHSTRNSPPKCLPMFWGYWSAPPLPCWPMPCHPIPDSRNNTFLCSWYFLSLTYKELL